MSTESSFWILWNPFSDLPPTYRFGSAKAALDGARRMAQKYGEIFYVCRAEAAVTRVPTTVVAPTKAVVLKPAKKGRKA